MAKKKITKKTKKKTETKKKRTPASNRTLGSQRRSNWRTKDRELRSKFEDRIKEDLTNRNVTIQYEVLRIQYIQKKKYTPDFILPNGIIIEVKGFFDADERRKHIDIKKQYPDLDIRFVFLRNNKVRKGAKMTYSSWCEKNGFKYSFGTIPDEWLEEETCVVKLTAIKKVETQEK